MGAEKQNKRPRTGERQGQKEQLAFPIVFGTAGGAMKSSRCCQLHKPFPTSRQVGPPESSVLDCNTPKQPAWQSWKSHKARQCDQTARWVPFRLGRKQPKPASSTLMYAATLGLPTPCPSKLQCPAAGWKSVTTDRSFCNRAGSSRVGQGNRSRRIGKQHVGGGQEAL